MEDKIGMRCSIHRIKVKCLQNVKEPLVMRPFGICKRRQWATMEMYIREMEYEGMKWIQLAQDRQQWWALENV
jgi:hypothetical protein